MMTAAAEKFLAERTLTSLLSISRESLSACARKAYELFAAGQYREAEVFGRGLVAADHRDWYYRTLLAATLQKQGRTQDAVAILDEGLTYLPANPDLLALRAVLTGRPL